MADAPGDGDKNGADDDYPLSAAFLAPLNSIFEAQIHAARSFLNLLLKMGFRHRNSPEVVATSREAVRDLETEAEQAGGESNLTEEKKELLQASRGIVAEDKEFQDQKKEMQRLFRLRNEQGRLNAADIAKLKDLNARYGDLYQQSIDFINNDGNQVTVNIPNLALLPIKPLSISEADVSFEFQTAKDRAEKWQNKDDGDKKLPWYLVQEPKSLKGNIVASREDKKASSISVNMKIQAAEMPEGLQKLMIHLTNSIEQIDTNELEEQPKSDTQATDTEEKQDQ